MMQPLETGGNFGDVAIGTSHWRAAILRGLNILTCHMCQPPMQVPDWVRLVMALCCFGGGAAAVSEGANCPGLSIAYCIVSLARLCTKGSSLAFIMLACGVAWAVMLNIPESPTLHIVTAAMILSEACWLKTLNGLLDTAFEMFTAVLWTFLGVMFSLGLYPLVMKLGESVFVQKQIEQVAKDTAKAVTAGDNAISQLLPLALLLIGVPAIAGVVLVYCHLFERMPRLFKGLACALLSFLALYGLLLALHIPVSEDSVFKAVFSTAWVAVYYAFAQMEFTDYEAVDMGPKYVAAVYLLMFVLDQVSSGKNRLHPRLLLAFAIACKMTYAAVANSIDACSTFLPEHLIPLRVVPQEPGATEVNDGSTGGNPVTSTVDSTAFIASTGGDMGTSVVADPPAQHYSMVNEEGFAARSSLRLPPLELPALPQMASSAVRAVSGLSARALRAASGRDVGGEGARELMMPAGAEPDVEASTQAAPGSHCT